MKTKTHNRTAGRFRASGKHDGLFPRTFPMTTINIEKSVIAENRKVLDAEEITLAEQAKLDAEVNKILESADRAYRDELMGELGFDYKLAKAVAITKGRQEFSMLPQDRIMDLTAIKKTCMDYSLRFLPTRLYKGALDAGIGAKLEEFKAKLDGKLPVSGAPELCQDEAQKNQEGRPQFYIAAPAESFELRPVPRDPLLFCRLNATKFFLLHKWGTDLDAKEVRDRKGQVTESNWNSGRKIMEDSAYMAYARSMSMNLDEAYAQVRFGTPATSTSLSQMISGTNHTANILWTAGT